MSNVVVDDRDLWILGGAFLMLAVAITVLVISLVVVLGLAHDAAETHNAVCVYRENLIEQIGNSERYLVTHPNGAPVLGLTAAQIQQSIARERAAADSLSGLNCN